MVLWLWVFLTSGVAWSADCTVLTSVTETAQFYFPDQISADGAVVITEGRIAATYDANPPLEFIKEGDDHRAKWNGRECALVDVSGMSVTPGLVAVSTQLGVIEVGAEKSTRDDAAKRADELRAHFKVTDGYNPRSSLIPVARTHGITSATVHPSGGAVSGAVGWVDLTGTTQREAIVDDGIAMEATADWLFLTDVLAEVRFWQKNRAAYDQNRIRPLMLSKPQLEALLPVVQMEQPLIVTVHRSADIEAAIRFQEKERVRLILRGVAEGWLVAAELATAEIPVIVNPLLNAPQSFDAITARADNAARLIEAGVNVIITSEQTHNARNLRQVAGNAVRAGVGHHDAVMAITQTPAEVFGVSDSGRLEAGAKANIVVWSGDPLELRTQALRVFVRGQSLPMTSRQKTLMERYRQLPGSPLPALDISRE